MELAELQIRLGNLNSAVVRIAKFSNRVTCTRAAANRTASWGKQLKDSKR